MLGTLAAIFLTLSFLSVGIYLLNRKKGENNLYSLGLMSAMIVVLIDAIFVRLDASITILIIMIAIITLGAILKESEITERYWKFSLRASSGHAPISMFASLVTIVVALFLFSFLVKVFAADILAGSADKYKSNSMENSVKKIERAIALNGREGRYYTLASQYYMTLANNEFLKGERGDKDLFEKYLDSAITLATKGKELMPKDVVAVETLAASLENKALYFPQFSEQAVAAYNDALVLEPHNPTYFLKIGKIRAMQASLEKDDNTRNNLITEAKDWFQKSVDQKNNLAEAQFQLGSMRQLLGEKDEAIESFNKAIEIDNSKLDYFFSLANAYQSRGSNGDYANAENIYKNIISVQGDDVNTHLSLGLLYEKMKRFSYASEQYKKVSDLLPQENTDARNKIQKMISNADQGIENTTENTNDSTATNQ